MANKTSKSSVWVVGICILGVFIMPYISSCGKGGQASSVGLNTQLQVLNLSPDVHPINFYMGFIKQNGSPYYYPSSSGYFFLNSIDTPLQIRSALTTTTNLISISNPGFKANHKYSLFITGSYRTDSTVSAIFTQDDTTAIPKVGFGKIRFVNASVQSPNINVTANGTPAFTDVKYLEVTKYIELPAGSYNFQMSPSGSTTVLTTLNTENVPIQDGRLYTLYCYGITLKTDTSAFGANVLINR